MADEARQRRGRGFQVGLQAGRLYSDDARSGEQRADSRGAGLGNGSFGHDTRGGGPPGPRPNNRPPFEGQGRGPVSNPPLDHITTQPSSQDAPATSLSSSELKTDNQVSEYGVVVTVRDSFGFIQCYKRDQQVFFHISELQVDNIDKKPDLASLIEPGDEVEFQYIANDIRTGRPMAKQVRVLPRGWLDQEDLQEGVLQGVVDRELRGGQKNRADAYGGRILASEVYYSFSGGDLSDSNARLSVGDEVEFQVATGKRKGGEPHATRIKFKSRPRQDRPPQRLPAQQAPPAESAREKGIVATLRDTFGFIKRCGPVEGRIFYHFSAVEGGKQLKVNDEVEYTVQPDRHHDKMLAINVKLLPKGTLSPEVSEDRKTGVVAKAASKQRSQEYEDGLIHYTDLAGKHFMLCYGLHGQQDPEAEITVGDEVSFRLSSRGLTRGNLAVNVVLSKPWTERRELGVILLIKDNKFGFIECTERDEDMFFHMSELGEGNSEVTIGDTIQFTPVRDYRTGKDNAVKVRLAPKEAVVMDEIGEEKLEGFCTERVKDAKGRGQLEFKSKGVMETLLFATSDLEDYRWIPRVGDKVKFQLAIDKRTGKRRATNVGICEVNGVIDYLKDTYGFIACPAADTGRVFFHTSEVQGGITVKEGDHVAFIIVHNLKTDETAAKKVRRTREAGERPRRPPPQDEAQSSSGPQKQGLNTPFRIAKGPDETRGFTIGRGRSLETLPALRKPKPSPQPIGEPAQNDPRPTPSNDNSIKPVQSGQPRKPFAQAPPTRSSSNGMGEVRDQGGASASHESSKAKPKLTSKLDPTSAPFMPSGLYGNPAIVSQGRLGTSGNGQVGVRSSSPQDGLVSRDPSRDPRPRG